MKVKSGITVSITSEFFQEYRDDILTNFEDSINGMELPDSTQETQFSIWKVVLVTRNQKL